MAEEPSIVEVETRLLAAVRHTGPWRQVMPQMMSSLDDVWTFIRGYELVPGHNIFLYEPIATYFGVEVFEPIEEDDRIKQAETPEGRAATIAHIGPYSGIVETSRGLIAWCEANGHKLTGTSWEVYGDWDEDEAKLRTDVYFGLAEA
jgi:effector-binding domain-containing protein